MPSDPRKFDGANRPDETPPTFAGLKPLGYWSATLGYFVPVREVPDSYVEENEVFRACLEAERLKREGKFYLGRLSTRQTKVR